MTENSQKKIEGCQGVSVLRSMYKVSDHTWSKWISKIPDLKLEKGQRVYKPKQVEMIISHLGEP